MGAPVENATPMGVIDLEVDVLIGAGEPIDGVVKARLRMHTEHAHGI